MRAKDFAGALWGLGYAHAMDRGLQLLLMRILGRGRASELLDASDETLRIDLFFRRLGWHAVAATDDDAPTPETRTFAEAYCEGVNARLSRHVPWELRLAGYRPEPWTPDDSLLLARMIGYLGMAQSQAELERVIVEMVQAGIDRARLDELFPGRLAGLDEALLRQVRLGERLVPEGTRWGAALPRLSASNNWVLSGSRTRSGSPILANDPHLEGNRLPNVWYEAVLETPGRWALGATMPGLPGVLIGRNPDLAWGATYAFMDSVDSWVEDCRDGCFRRDEAAGTSWVPFRARREVVRRKGRGEHVAVFHENDHGVLDGDPSEPGLYLATRWSGSRAGWRSLESMCAMWEARSVAEGAAHLGRLEPAFNWVLADRSGHIGYQMSGRAPRRREGASGLVPLRGWDPDDDWRGFHEPDDLPRAFDPEEGFLVTANDDLNALGRVAPISVSMGPYRKERLVAVLGSRDGWTPEDLGAVQQDLRSTQAERFLAVLRPWLPDTPAARVLAEWDGRYDVDSQGASMFEEFHRELRREVFGAACGAAWEHLESETMIVAGFHHCFDRVLLAESSAWLGDRAREDVWRAALDRALAAPRQRWGESHRLLLKHLLLGERLPRWLGFDRGPIELPGGPATVQQGQILRSGGRDTSFVPTFRIVTDLGEARAFTSLLGGPSDRRFSRWYASEVEGWRAGRYKELAPEEAPSSQC